LIRKPQRQSLYNLSEKRINAPKAMRKDFAGAANPLKNWAAFGSKWTLLHTFCYQKLLKSTAHLQVRPFSGGPIELHNGLLIEEKLHESYKIFYRTKP
jgi:hypothetical protein